MNQAPQGQSLDIVIFGKTGTGKSSLINTLFEEDVAKVSDSIFSVTEKVWGHEKPMESIEGRVRTTTIIVKDVRVTLWDTPGLADISRDGKETLKEIREKCGESGIDLFLYCARLDQTRLLDVDLKCINDITYGENALGPEIWERGLIAVTCANKMPSNINFQSRLQEWNEGFRFIFEKVKMSDQFESIPLLPTGYLDFEENPPIDVPLPDNRPWRSEFWYACLLRVRLFALPAMKLVAYDKMKNETERATIDGIFQKRMGDEPDSDEKVQVETCLASPDQDGCMVAIPNDSSTHGQNEGTVTPPTDTATESTDGNNDSQGTTTIVPLKKFRVDHPDYKDMKIVCNETFERLVKEYLASDRVLLEIKEYYMDEAFKGAKYDHSSVEVDLSSIKPACEPIKKCLGDPVTVNNNEGVERSKTFTQSVQFTKGTELVETISSGWSITGGLSAEYQGIGASTGIGYTEQQSQTMKQTKGEIVGESVTDTFFVQRQSSRRATVIRTIWRKECRVRNVRLSFPKNAELKCKFYMKGDDPKKVKKSPHFLIRDILDDYIENKSSDTLVAKLEGKCVWVETDLSVNVEEDVPLEKDSKKK